MHIVGPCPCQLEMCSVLAAGFLLAGRAAWPDTSTVESGGLSLRSKMERPDVDCAIEWRSRLEPRGETIASGDETTYRPTLGPDIYAS